VGLCIEASMNQGGRRRRVASGPAHAAARPLRGVPISALNYEAERIPFTWFESIVRLSPDVRVMFDP
jgi:hypothetical protein